MKLRELVDRRLICLGIWVSARRDGGHLLDDAWADDAVAAADRLVRRETWAIAGAALGQKMTVADRARVRRHAPRLGDYRAPPPEPPISDGEEEAERRRQWRAATVHGWLLLGELVTRRRRASRSVNRSWLDGVLRRANLRSEDLRGTEDRPPSPVLPVTIGPGGDIPLIEVEVDADGPLRALPPGARWYPQYRTVSLHCARGHLLVTGPGPANAVRSGPGFGSAIRDGVGHGNAVRRGGDGDAIRTGDGHGDAFRAGEGEGVAHRDGAGHGHALSLSAGGSGAVRLGPGDGHAVAESGLAGAQRTGDGNGDAYADAGPALRADRGDGDAVRRGGPLRDPPDDRSAIRSGDGDGDAYGELDGRGLTLRTGVGRGAARRWGESRHRSWTARAGHPGSGWAASPPPRTLHHLAGEATPPVHRVRVIRNGELRIPRRSPVVYDARTHTAVLDTELDGSLEVIGAGALNVERRGSGRGDAIRSERGHGNAVRSGLGDGHGVRRGTGYGDARRTGAGAGNAAVGERVVGRAVVAPESHGVCVVPAVDPCADRWGHLGPDRSSPSPSVAAPPSDEIS